MLGLSSSMLSLKWPSQSWTLAHIATDDHLTNDEITDTDSVNEELYEFADENKAYASSLYQRICPGASPLYKGYTLGNNDVNEESEYNHVFSFESVVTVFDRVEDQKEIMK